MDRFKLVKLLGEVVKAIQSTVDECGEYGAPVGLVYAALSAHGMSLNGFNEITAGMVDAGFITRRGNMFYSTKTLGELRAKGNNQAKGDA